MSIIEKKKKELMEEGNKLNQELQYLRQRDSQIVMRLEQIKGGVATLAELEQKEEKRNNRNKGKGKGKKPKLEPVEKTEGK